jgi:hypothetical protein
LKNIHLDVSTIFKYSFQQTQDKFVQWIDLDNNKDLWAQ